MYDKIFNVLLVGGKLGETDSMLRGEDAISFLGFVPGTGFKKFLNNFGNIFLTSHGK
jgi:hypothetical protein